MSRPRDHLTLLRAVEARGGWINAELLAEIRSAITEASKPLSASLPGFGDWLEKRIGTRKWCVAARLTDRLRGSGYDRALTPKAMAALENEHTGLLAAGKFDA